MSRIGSVGYILVHNVFELSFTPKPYFPYYFLLEKFKNYYICQVMRNSRTYLFAFPYPVNFIGWWYFSDNQSVTKYTAASLSGLPFCR